jgi:hypothetical protein
VSEIGGDVFAALMSLETGTGVGHYFLQLDISGRGESRSHLLLSVAKLPHLIREKCHVPDTFRLFFCLESPKFCAVLGGEHSRIGLGCSK